MNIVCCTDNNYIMPCGVLFCSICENNKDVPIHFFVVADSSVDQSCKSKLSSIVDKYSQKQLSFININSVGMDNLPGLHNGHYITKAAYYRLFLASLLPDDINKVIYLDCDMIVRKSLMELWKTSLDGYAIGVVADMCEIGISHYNNLHYPLKLGYFNSGMLLVNLKYWRKENLEKKFLDYLYSNFSNINCHDQDVLNFVCRECKVNIPLTYNFQDGFIYKNPEFDYWKYFEEINATVSDPCIIHYTRRKPWQKECIHPFKNVWRYYALASPWKDYKLQKTNRKMGKIDTLKYILRSLHLLGPEWSPFKEIRIHLDK